MAIRVALRHSTEYQYDRLVHVSPHILRLRPAAHCRTPILSYSLEVEPAQHFLNWQQDAFGNYLARLVFPEPTQRLHFEVGVVAEMVVINPFDFFLDEEAEHYPFRYSESLARDLAPYLEVRESGVQLSQWVRAIDRHRKRTVDFLVELNCQLQQQVRYTIRMEPGVQSCEETLTLRSGSCRDSGWLLVQILRHLGLAARFVSGYLVQLAPDLKSLDGPSGPSHDFTDLHAWAEVYVPGAGWIGLDPTSGLFAGEGHLPLVCTPDPIGAAPITGATDAAHVTFSYSNHVQRVHEDPRVTKPFRDDQWQRIDQLGQQVDSHLLADDVRLTMGGEPTFVSIDDMDGAEWTTAALGPNKRRLAAQLTERLRQRFTMGGVLHFGQGKLYPGEVLPRWALSCFWRADGEPVWHRPELYADETVDAGRSPRDAERFAIALARRIGVTPECVQSGYEDTYYYLWREGTLPVDVDPLQADLEDPSERRRLRELLERGLGTVAGYALPLRWSEYSAQQGHWESSRWSLRRGRLYLLPGDSPMGYRLPLDSLPQAPRPSLHEHSLFAPRSELGDIHGLVAQRYAELHAAVARADVSEQHADAADEFQPSSVIHTALCTEARHGRLYVFLPPLTHLEHYLDLVACIEATAAELDLPVLIEGYEPPRDPRLRRFQVTPDPGVIEVNIHPAASWKELREHTEILYEEARQCRLGTEKFMVDGRHTGTGGGNHVTIGGPTPADSPILRRPQLLQSLITYWQHHPSLSYLFSGMFIGPTSQAPRVDEARDDSLYEIEIAFQQMPDGEVPQPWLVDRLLRNLLVDVSGNTHRTELCIDKLYSPDSAVGRLGLVELRAFEMPPHPQMSLVQNLLLRALVARFWRAPYTRPMVRWGTELHDRFLLPHYVWEDFRDVVCDLQRAGFAFELDWFLPFFEFRFPHYGAVQVGDVQLDLRMALEPWHVLGEEVKAQGTARFVDSSVERLQLRAFGLVPERHVVTCNGRVVPLQPTATPSQFVAGVRYRAWQPPSALHPTIAVHTPLVFDLVDTWNDLSLGGCTYHVGHPGGRHYESAPVNAYEAESRRIARFWPNGESARAAVVPPSPPQSARDFPFTLDLRYRDGG